MPSQSSRTGAPKPDIPDKLYFRIGEVARLCAVPAYVLRFWESEFTQLRPNKSGTGQRLYRKRDVEIALRIKRLLYDEGYTIAGARHAFQAESRLQSEEKSKGLGGSHGRKKIGQPELPLAVAEEKAQQRLHHVRTELRDLLALLSSPTTTRTRRTTRRDGDHSTLFED